MGAKGVGLAKLQTYIENLKRELSLNGSTVTGVNRGIKKITTSSGGSDTLTAADSGKIIFVNGSVSGNHTITLPDPSSEAGLEYVIILNADNHGSTKVFVDSGLSSGIKGMLKVLAASGIANVLNHANQKLGFGVASKIGATIHVVSNGSFYHVVEAVSDVTFVTS